MYGFYGLKAQHVKLALTPEIYPAFVPAYTKTTLPNVCLPEPTTQILFLSALQSIALAFG